MNKGFVFFSCLLLTVELHAESLSEIYLAALQNDYQLKAAESASLAEQESKNIARSRLLPKIDAEGAWTHSETTEEVHPQNPFALNVKRIQHTTGPGYSISLTQPLIDMTAYQDYQRSELTGQIANLSLKNAQSSLILRTADAYLQAVRAGAKLAAAQSAEEAYGLQLKAANKRFNVGLAKISDGLEAQARNDSAVANTATARNNLNISFDFLSVITGQRHTSLNALADNFVATSPVPSDFQQWSEAAQKNNLEINLAKLKADEALKNYKARKSEHLPKLAGNLSYSENQYDRNYNTAAPDNLYDEGVSASIILRVPLYSGGSVSASAREANYRYFELSDLSNHTIREVMQETHSLYLSTVASVAVVNARKAAIASSQSALLYARRGYEEGVRSMIDVLNAQNILYQANQDYSDALYEYLISGLRLRNAAGMLSERDIEELSKQLDPTRKIELPSSS